MADRKHRSSSPLPSNRKFLQERDFNKRTKISANFTTIPNLQYDYNKTTLITIKTNLKPIFTLASGQLLAKEVKVEMYKISKPKNYVCQHFFLSVHYED